MKTFLKGLVSFGVGTGGLIAATSIGADPATSAGVAASVATFVSTIGGGIAGNVAHEAMYGGFDRVANALDDASKAGHLPLNHDFARAARRAQLDGVRYMLLRYRDEIRSDTSRTDYSAEEQFISEALTYVRQARRETEGTDFLIGEPIADYLAEVVPTTRLDDNAPHNPDCLDILKEAEHHTLKEIEEAIKLTAPADFAATFLMEGNTVCWQSAAQAFFIETVKTDEVVKTVVLFDRLEKLDDKLSDAVALMRKLAGDLGKRFDANDREIAVRSSSSIDRQELAAFLRGAVTDERLEFSASLQRLLDARFPKDLFQASITAEEVARIFNRRSKRFIGRREPIATLEGQIVGHGSSLTILTAPPGMGKSALMAEMVRRRIDAGDLVVRHFILSQELRTVDEIDIFGHFVAQVAAIYGVDQRPELNERALADWLHHRLKQDREEDQRLVLFLDGIDESNSDRLFQFLPDRLGNGVHVVVSCRATDLEVPKALKGWLTPRPDIESRRIVLEPMGMGDIKWWLEDFVGHIDDETAAKVAAKLERSSDGIPLFLSYLIEEVHTKLAKGTSVGALLAEVGDLPEPFDEYVRIQLETLDGEVEWSSGAQFVLALLTLTKSSISLQDIKRIITLARQAGEDVSNINLDALDHRVARWMILQRDERTTKLQFVHPRLAEVFSRVLDYRTEVARSCLIDLCKQWQSQPAEYAMQSGVEHMLEGVEASSGLVDLETATAPLFDVGYLAERGMKGRISSILQCLSQATGLATNDARYSRWSQLISRDYQMMVDAHFGAVKLGLWRDKVAQFSGSASIPGTRTHRQAQAGVLEGHTGSVLGVLALDDGRFLSWSRDWTLRLWDSEGHPLGTPMEGHILRITDALALEDGRFLSCGADDTLRLWAGEGELLGAPMKGHIGSVNGALALEDGRFLSWSRDGTLRLWDSEGHPLGAPMEGHADWVNGALALYDGRFLSWSDEGTLRLWNSEGQPLGAPLKGHLGSVNGALALKDGRFLSWSRDWTLRLWDSEGQSLGAPKEGHAGSVSGALALEDGRFLSWSHDRTLRLWGSEAQSLAVFSPFGGAVLSVTSIAGQDLTFGVAAENWFTVLTLPKPGEE